MNKLYRKTSILVGALLLMNVAFADDHGASAQSATMAQVNLCYLEDGKTMADVDELNADFFSFLDENDLAPLSVILTPVATGNHPSEPAYDFIEMMFAEHAKIGQMWDQVLGSKTGQKIMADWEEMTNCVTRFNHLIHRFRDAEAQSSTDSRVVEFNRCKVHPEVEGNRMREIHDDILANRSPDATNLYWGLLIPEIGDSIGTFRHLVAFPDMAAYTQAVAARTSAEYRANYRDYNRRWAQCDGRSVWQGRVQNRP